jgi:hypothetical protein
MTLQDLLQRALREHWLPPSYEGPLRTYVKRYARALGHEAEACPPAVYHLPPERLRDLVHTSAGEGANPRSIQACVNTLVKMLQRAEADGHLPPLQRQPRRQSLHRIYHPLRYLQRYHPERVPTDIPERGYTRYGLTDWPLELAQETAAYLQWCTPQVQRGRSKRIRKVESSQTYTIQAIGYVAGYAVTIEGVAKDTLTLRLLCEPKRLEEFAWWWLQERRGVSTRSLTKILGVLKTITRHWYKDEPLAQQIVSIFRRLDEEAPAQTVREKEGRLLPLEELDRIARCYHPLAEGHLQALKDNKYAKRLLYHLADPTRHPLAPSQISRRPDRKGITNFTHLAMWFELSLILRLLIHRPLRIGNIAALQFRHLQPTGDGGYEIVIPKAEMKNGKFMDRKEWRERFPTRLLPLFQEWLTIWRPRLQRKDGSYQEYVFLNTWGRPHAVAKLSTNFALMTLRMTHERHGGPVAWHPHLIRTTWTKEMLHAGLNPYVVKRILGDSFKVIDKHYGGYQDGQPSAFARQLAKEIGDGID